MVAPGQTSSLLQSEFLTMIQRLDPEGKGKKVIMEQLLQLASRGFFQIPVQYLEPLLTFLDPDYDCSEMLIHLTLELVSLLVREPYFANFFGQPHPLQLIWGYYPDPKSMTCLEYILKQRPTAVETLIENDLMSQFESMSESIDETDLRLISICIEVAPSIFESNQIVSFLEGANSLLAGDSDTNVKYEALSLIAKITSCFPDVSPALLSFYTEYPVLNEDDCTTPVILQIYSNMLKALKSFEPFVVPPVLDFLMGIFQRKSEWIRAALVFLNTGNVDIVPLASNEPLVMAVFSVFSRDTRFEARDLALLFISNVLRECQISLRDKILECGYISQFDESLGSYRPQVQVAVLRTVGFFLERKQVSEELLSDSFLSAVQDAVESDDELVASTARCLLEILNH